MSRILSAMFVALLCGACGKAPTQPVTTIDQDVKIELAVRMEVNGMVDDVQKANFSIAKGSEVPIELNLTSGKNNKLTFRNFRLKSGKAEFESWGFDGFLPLSSKSGTKGTAWPYNSKQSGGFSLPTDGSKKLDELLTWFDKTAINGELMKSYVTLEIRTN